MAQHDYVIANGSGSAVRADLNDALAAIVSLNSGTSEPTDTFAYMLWADTTAGVLKIRNAANNAWITLRELDGTLTIEAGSASTPGLYFTGDANTGIYSPGADQFAIATNGVERVEWGTSGVVFNDGGRNYDFRIEGDADTDLFFVDASADTVAIAGLTHPTADGTADQSLVTNGSGTLSFASRSRLVRATAVTASGASVTFSSIPSWARRITFTFVGLSLNGTSDILARIGDSGGVETTGYVSSSNYLQGGTTSDGTSSTSGFVLYGANAANAISGQLVLANYDGNGWVATGMWDYSNGTGVTGMAAGYKVLSATLDRLQILAANGTDSFDAGTVNIIYEG